MLQCDLAYWKDLVNLPKKVLQDNLQFEMKEINFLGGGKKNVSFSQKIQFGILKKKILDLFIQHIWFLGPTNDDFKKWGQALKNFFLYLKQQKQLLKSVVVQNKLNLLLKIIL